MCGITGYTHMSKRLPEGVLPASLAAIAHRGPDHEASFSSPHISLGATRLRILDLHGGDQPLFSPDRDVVLVFNGEIYNHREIRGELENEGFRFQTHCDTEVLLQAFRRWDTECFRRLRGMFALAIWVQSERRLVLARDPMGIKPLYYCEQDGDIYFGSELKCLFAHPGVRRNLCLPALDCFLSLNYVPGPQTLVEGIVKLMPGEMLQWHAGGCQVERYVPPLAAAPPPRTIAQACEELDGLLAQSVKEQLASDVPVALWLSGGLDSATILHYAAPVAGAQLQTFSVTFRGRTFDESRNIRLLADRYGTRHVDFDLNPGADLVGAIEQIAYYSDEPSADAGAVPAWFLAQMTRPHATVVLTGEGADELFAGYLTYRADRYAAWARKVPAPLRRAALACALRLPVSDDKISFEYMLKRFLQGSLLSPEAAHLFWNGTFSQDEKLPLFVYANCLPWAELLARVPAGTGCQRFLDFDQACYLPDDILYKVDRMSMAHSLEVRPPFLDRRIVEFAARLPEDFKLRGSQSKYVLRRLMQHRLPAAVLRGPKIGFDIPVHDWLRGVLRPFLLETLSQETVESAGLFRWPAVQALIRQHLERKANLGYHLWGLLTLTVWMKRWNIELAQEEAAPAEQFGEILDEVGLSYLRLRSSSSSAL